MGRCLGRCVGRPLLLLFLSNPEERQADQYDHADRLSRGAVYKRQVQMRDALKALYEDYKKVPAHETLLQMSQHRKVLAEMRSVLASLYGSTPSLLTRGKIPEADIVMLDELFKANGGVLHSLLTALNERLYANEGRELKLPTISFFGASNEMPNPYDPEERKYLPLLDRFDLKVKTEYIQDREQRLALLEKKEKDEYDAPLKTQLTMDELGKMQKEVKTVTVPKAVSYTHLDVYKRQTPIK